jgi:hypothetical protein
MEVFVDGGLFELFALLAFGCAINFIFAHKYLLLLFSAVAFAGPVGLLFVSENLRAWPAGFCILTGALLTFLLWKMRLARGDRPLFDLNKLKKNLPAHWRKLPFQRTGR